MNLKKLAAIAASVAFMIAPVTAARADALPTAPTNVAATATGPSIRMTWDAPNAFTEGVTEFDPYVSADKGKTWTKTDPLTVELAVEDNLVGFEQTIGWWGKYQMLKPLASYRVKVVAVSPAGSSADSTTSTVKIPAVAPIFGTGAVQADAKIKFNKGVNVKWSLTSDGGKPVTSFTVKYRKFSADNTGAWTVYKKVSAKTFAITIPYSKLKAWNDFEIAVDATNAIGTSYGSCEIKVDAKGNISVWV